MQTATLIIVSVGLETPQGGSGGGIAWPLNHYPRREAGLGGRVRELAILTTARELDTSPALELDPRTGVSLIWPTDAARWDSPFADQNAA